MSKLLFFSELQGYKVYTDAGNYLGKLVDFSFSASENSQITKIVVKTKDQRIAIPVEFVIRISDRVIISSFYIVANTLDTDELSIASNLLDKQIIDIKGEKVVRVNDVVIQQNTNQKYSISGVDIGVRALLRWLGLEKLLVPFYKTFQIYSHPHFLKWADIEPLELSSGNVRLKKEEKDLEKLHPEDLADYLEKTDITNVGKIVSNLSKEFAADVIGDLDENLQNALFTRFSPVQASQIIDHLDPDEAVDILLTLPKDQRKKITDLLSKQKRSQLFELMTYSQTPIGELIDPKFLSVSYEDTVSTALKKVKDKVTSSDFFAYLYVINENKELKGTVAIYKLLTLPPESKIKDIMEKNLVEIYLTTSKKIATQKMLRYKLFALPVLSENRKLLGIVTYDELVEDLLPRI